MDLLWNAIQDSLPATNPVIVFAAVMVIVLLVPPALRRVGVPAPGLVGLILAGAIVGEHGLNLLERSKTVGLIGTVGLLYLMFTAGLSMDLGQFERTRGRSIGFGLLSFFIPQLMAFGVGMFMLEFTALQAALLGSIVGSHTLLAYPVIKRLGITRNRAVTVAMGGTILTDGIALAVLAGVVAYQTAEDGIGIGFWMRFAGLLLVFVAAVVFGLPALGRWFFRTVRERGEMEFVFLLAALFITASLSQYVGLAPIVGAFLAGLALNRLVPDTGPLMSRVHFVGEALLIPFFLLSVGMLVDVRVLTGSAEVWVYALAFSAMVFIGKAGAAKLAELMFGLRSSEGWTMAGLTIPQAAATLAVTLIGFQIGLFNDMVVNAVVVLMLASCLVGPWMVERFGRRVALEEADEPIETGDGGPQRILVPLANPATADALMDVAFMLRRADSPEPIYPLTVARDGPDVEEQVAAGERLLSHAVVHAAAAGAPVLPTTRVDYNVAQGIERAVRERRISTLIIGWNGQVTSRQAVLGSILDQILQSPQQTMVICRFADDAPPLNTTRRVLAIVPRFVERERGFGEALRMLKTLAKEVGAASVLLAAPRIAIERVGKAAESCPPQIDVNPLPIQPGASLLESIEASLRTDDLVLLISSRPGRLSWSHELARLPHLLARELPKQNFLIVYPSEAQPLRTAERPLRSEPLLSEVRIGVDVPGDRVDAALEQLLKPHFSDRLHVLTNIHAELMRSMSEIAMEVMPGVVLLHRHVERVTSPIVFIGISQSGLSVPGVKSPAKVILVLLSPIDLPPDEHLAALAEIARMMSQPRVLDQLLAATNPKSVINALAPQP